jgi:hypothetical protein
MAWRVARSLLTLREECNQRWPDRSKVSDGTIGDPAHATRTSDHNAWVIDPSGVGVVRALDITAKGIDAPAYAEHVRQLGASGDRRLNPSGYVIWDRRIASSSKGWGWRAYSGKNPHTQHCHVSVTTVQAGYDDGGPWGVLDLGRKDDDDMPLTDDDLARIAQKVWTRDIKTDGGAVRSAEAILAGLNRGELVGGLVDALLDLPIDRSDLGAGPTSLRQVLRWSDRNTDRLARTIEAAAVAASNAPENVGEAVRKAVADAVRESYDATLTPKQGGQS